MNKEEALKKAKETYEKTIEKINLAEKLCKIVDPLLPSGWKSEFQSYFQEVEFSKDESSDAIEFRVVCDTLEKITGYELSRRIGGDKENQHLFAYGHYDNPNGHSWITVNINLNKPEGCKITFKRTWETKPIVDEKCLGIHKEVKDA